MDDLEKRVTDLELHFLWLLRSMIKTLYLPPALRRMMAKRIAELDKRENETEKWVEARPPSRE